MYSDVLPYTKCTLATTSPSSFEFLSKINTVFQNHFGHSFFYDKTTNPVFFDMSTENLGQSLYDI